MANRLSTIVTRTGDDGNTGLGDGSRTGKDSLRIAAIGDVDELNSLLGWLRSETVPEAADRALQEIQHQLFDLGAELSLPGQAKLSGDHVARLDAILQQWQQGLPPLREFILPGGSRPAAIAHVSRAVCRRAERSLVTLSRKEKVGIDALAYLNRLSDLLFVLARMLNAVAEQRDEFWETMLAQAYS